MSWTDKLPGTWKVTNGQPIIARIGIPGPDEITEEDRQLAVAIMERAIEKEEKGLQN